jgi:hypothetical protein
LMGPAGDECNLHVPPRAYAPGPWSGPVGMSHPSCCRP